MFVFFHPIGCPWWLALVLLALIIVSVWLTARGAYVLARTKSFRLPLTVFGVFSIIWATFLLTQNELLKMICVAFTLPFGIFAGMPLLILGEPPESMIYFGAALLNLTALAGAVDVVKTIRARKRLT